MNHLDEALKPYRNKTEYRHIGKSVRRQDGEAIVTGKALYCDDIYIPNALYMKVLRSPHPHAEVVSIDTSEALALPGVEAIMTHEIRRNGKQDSRRTVFRSTNCPLRR